MNDTPLIVDHTAFVDAQSELTIALRHAAPGAITALVGLAGSGKSEIRWAVMRALFGDANAWGTGQLPATLLLAKPVERGLYNSKDMATRLVQAVQDPTLDWLKRRNEVANADVVHLINQVKLESCKWVTLRRETTEPAMLRQFIDSAIARGLRLLAIEQAGSMTHVKRGTPPSHHLASLMCTAMEAKIHILLIGVPATSYLWVGNEEVSRRTQRITIRRYRYDVEADRKCVASLLIGLTPDLDQRERDLMFKRIDWIFASTLGVYDELHQFVGRALSAKRNSGSKILKDEHLQLAIHPEVRLEALYSSATLLDTVTKATDAATAISLMRESLKDP